MLEKMIEGLAAGGPMYILFGGMLWLWVRQSEKHEQHWLRMMTENLAAQERRGASDMELAKALGRMGMVVERVLDHLPEIESAAEVGEGSRSRRR